MNNQDHIAAVFIGNHRQCWETIAAINEWLTTFSSAQLPKVVKVIDQHIAAIDADRKARPHGEGRVQRMRDRRNLVMRRMAAQDLLVARINAC